MNCDTVRPLLAADVDDELDPGRHLEIEAHVATCRACARQLAGARSWRDALRRALPQHAAPAGLAERIAQAIAGAEQPAARARAPGRPRRPILHAVALVAAVLLGLLVGRQWGAADTRVRGVFAESVAAHVRSLQVDHLTDVLAGDQHTVKPWFAGKLDFPPPVPDLTAAGFDLVGGRLDRVDGHAVAALVFRRRQHAINLFVWPVRDAPLAEQQQSLDGYHARSWSRGDFNFLAVSELAEAELAAFAAAFRN